MCVCIYIHVGIKRGASVVAERGVGGGGQLLELLEEKKQFFFFKFPGTTKKYEGKVIFFLGSP